MTICDLYAIIIFKVTDLYLQNGYLAIRIIRELSIDPPSLVVRCDYQPRARISRQSDCDTLYVQVRVIGEAEARATIRGFSRRHPATPSSRNERKGNREKKAQRVQADGFLAEKRLVDGKSIRTLRWWITANGRVSK